MRNIDVYCPCGKWIGWDVPDTWTDPGYYEGNSDYYSQKLHQYFCSPDCLNEAEEEGDA